MNSKKLPFFQISSMPPIANTEIPSDLYWVLTDPAPLAGMRDPGPTTSWESLYEAGFRYVICLARENPFYDPAPLKLACAVALEDLVSGRPPRDPDREVHRIQTVAGEVLKCLARGEGVVVHCVGGRGRTGTVLGCALRMLGYDSDEVVSFLDQVHKARGKPGWPEASWQSEVVSTLVLKRPVPQ